MIAAEQRVKALEEENERLQSRAAEKERLRFEGDLDKWMKIIGAGITGFQPEAYAVMDETCREFMRLREENEQLRRRVKWLDERSTQLERLFDKQWTRTRIAHEHWRQAHPGNELVNPDLGELVQWLMDKAGLSEAGRAALKGGE